MGLSIKNLAGLLCVAALLCPFAASPGDQSATAEAAGQKPAELLEDAPASQTSADAVISPAVSTASERTRRTSNAQTALPDREARLRAVRERRAGIRRLLMSGEKRSKQGKPGWAWLGKEVPEPPGPRERPDHRPALVPSASAGPVAEFASD